MRHTFVTLNLSSLLILVIAVASFATTSLALEFNYIDDNHEEQFRYKSRFSRSLESILNGLASLDESASSHRQKSHPQDSSYRGGGVNNKAPRLSVSSSQYRKPSQSHHHDHSQRTGSDSRESDKGQGQRRLDLDNNFPMIPFPPELPPLPLYGNGGLLGFEDDEGKDTKGLKSSSSKHNDRDSYNTGQKIKKEKGKDYEDDYSSGNEYPDSKYSPYESTRGNKKEKNDDERYSSTKEIASSPAPFYPSHGPAPQELRLPMFSYRRNQEYSGSTVGSSDKGSYLKGKHDSINSVINEDYEQGRNPNFRGFHRLPTEEGISSYGSGPGHSRYGAEDENHSAQRLAEINNAKYHELGDGHLSYPSHGTGGYGLPQIHVGQYSPSRYGNHGSGHGHLSYIGHGSGHDLSAYGNKGTGHHLPSYGIQDSGHGQISYGSHGSVHGHSSHGVGHEGYGTSQLSHGGHQLSYPGLAGHHSVIPAYPSSYGIDYKGHQTAVNAAALQAIKGITSLDHDASYSYAGLGGLSSGYNGISGFAGLYR